MIENKIDLKRYLESDKIALGRKRKRPKFSDYIWKYEICLRKCEYYNNKNRRIIMDNIIKIIYKYRKFILGNKLGYDIPLNVFDEGLSIAHKGPIVVNSGARIGKNCRIHICVNIGTSAGKEKEAPYIGDNCYIGPGAKIFGKIIIGNNIAIGANAVVNKSFEQNNITIAGVPAKKVSEKGSTVNITKNSQI